MPNILITGGAGHIGSAMALKLSQDSNNRIIIVDNLSTGNKSKIPQAKNIKFIKADINNYEDIVPIFGRYDFDFVFLWIIFRVS